MWRQEERRDFGISVTGHLSTQHINSAADGGNIVISLRIRISRLFLR